MKRAFFILLLLANLACAQYYADVSFDIGEDGSVDISGTSNHPGLVVSHRTDLTSKAGSNWVFNMSLPTDERFSDIVYEVILPAGAEINYAKTKGQFRISADGGRMAVSGTSSDTEMSIIIQYRIGQVKSIMDWAPYGVLFLFFVILALFVIKRRKITSNEMPHDLTERQKQILEYVRRSSESVTQTQVGEALGLAKSSVSRNVDTLLKKGYIVKESIGMSSYLSVKKE